MTSQQIIKKASQILNLEGVEFSFSGESNANGISVYFKGVKESKEVKVRFSNHSISNIDRMSSEVCFDVYLLNNEFHINSRIAQIGYMLDISGYSYGKTDCEMPNGKIMKGFSYFKI